MSQLTSDAEIQVRLEAMEKDLERTVRDFVEELRTQREYVNKVIAVNERSLALSEKLLEMGRQMTEMDTRMRHLEMEHPRLKETRSWVISGISALLAALLTYLASDLVQFKRPELKLRHTPDTQATVLYDKRQTAITPETA